MVDHHGNIARAASNHYSSRLQYELHMNRTVLQEYNENVCVYGTEVQISLPVYDA